MSHTSTRNSGDVIQCVIVDDHRLLLDLMTDAVGGIRGLNVIATATDVGEADRLAALHRIDLLIVDRQLKTGDGIDLVRTVAARHPGMKCIVVAGVTSDFVCPSDLLPVVVSVIDKTHACEMLLDEIARVATVPREPVERRLSAERTRALLTAREMDIFLALGQGLSNKELGSHFGISTRTVETHRKAIARKLGVSGSALVRLAVLQNRAPRDAPPPPGRMDTAHDG